MSHNILGECDCSVCSNNRDNWAKYRMKHLADPTLGNEPNKVLLTLDAFKSDPEQRLWCESVASEVGRVEMPKEVMNTTKRVLTEARLMKILTTAEEKTLLDFLNRFSDIEPVEQAAVCNVVKHIFDQRDEAIKLASLSGLLGKLENLLDQEGDE